MNHGYWPRTNWDDPPTSLHFFHIYTLDQPCHLEPDWNYWPLRAMPRRRKCHLEKHGYWIPRTQMTRLFWLEFGPCFGGLTFKNRGHLGSRFGHKKNEFNNDYDSIFTTWIHGWIESYFIKQAIDQPTERDWICHKSDSKLDPPSTPWKINMEPKKCSLEGDFPFQRGDF